MEKEYFIGIDYGTSNSSVGIYMNSNVNIAPNRIGERITPSIIYFSEDSDKMYIGEEALCHKIERNNLIYEVKRFIGLSYDEFINNEYAKKLNYNVVNDNGKPKIKVKHNGKEELYTAEEISAFIIKKIIRNAEDFIEDKINKAVITVPVYFNDQQINGIIEAANLANIKIMRDIKEPTAAALAYGFGKDLIDSNNQSKIFSSINNFEVAPSANEKFKTEENIIVFDLGGGTFDITLLNIRKENDNLNFDVISTMGDSNLGGSDFDNRLIDYCIKYICKLTKKDEQEIKNNKIAYKRLKVKCENAKKILSVSDVATINFENLNNEFDDINININHDKFEEICSDLFKKIKSLIDELLEENKINDKDIDAIILVGGATKMKEIKNLLKKKFSEEKIKDNLNPDETVAIGAALDAAKIGKKDKINFNLQDVISYNLGIEIGSQSINEIRENKGQTMYPIVKKYTKIPYESEEKSFTVNLSKNCNNIIINIYEGNDKNINKNKKLGTMEMSNINKLGLIKYTIKFKIDVNGKLTSIIKVDSLSREEEKVIKEGITHAFLDEKNKKIKICKSEGISTIESIISKINYYKESIPCISNIDKKVENLMEFSKEYEELINNYIRFIGNNDYILEKIYYYTKELFKIYSELISFKENKKVKIQEIIDKIKEKMKTLISVIGYVNDLMDIFEEILVNNKKEFYKILTNYLELMNIEGSKGLKTQKFKRYFSKLYFENAFYAIKKYIRNEDFSIFDDRDIKEKLDEQKNLTITNLNKINSFAHLIESLAKEEELIFGKTGLTLKYEQIKKLENPDKITTEEVDDLLDIFENMANTYDKKVKNIFKAYCYANIIKINYKILRNNDYDKLEDYIEIFKENLKGEEYEKLKWYKDIKKIIEEIEKNIKK